MLYNQLEAILYPFFLTRWWNDLAWPETLENYINLVIQDIYNEENWSFRIKNEEVLVYLDQNWRRRFQTTEAIDQIIEIRDQNDNDLFPTANFLKELNHFNFEEKNIYLLLEDINWSTQDITSIRISYTKQYTWYQHNVDWLKPIPMPNKFIPVIIKWVYDYAAPINLFDWEQTQVDFFGHYTNRTNKLKDMDSLSESTDFIPVTNYF